MKILVTGAAGFIGFHLIERLAQKGHEVVGIDNINNYYDVNLKFARLAESGISRVDVEQSTQTEKLNSNSVKNLIIKSTKYNNYRFVKIDLIDLLKLETLFKKEKFTHVVNLAAQAGVRYSIDNPHTYVQSNLVGFVNILECCRHHKIEHLLYASSSSVYGSNSKVPFTEKDSVDNPVSLYAATKKSNELMAHTYSHLYDLPTTGLRFFTVYGPWGRPDMAIYLFANAITNEKPIKVFNNGNMSRDFTYITDIVDGIEILIKNKPKKEKNKPAYQILNIGNGKPQSLLDFIRAIETSFGIIAKKQFLPMQDGDVPRTWADTKGIALLGYNSSIEINEGVELFVKWFKKYHKKN